MGRMQLYSFGWAQGLVTGSCECGNETSHSIKGSGTSWLIQRLLGFQKELCSMELVT